MQIRSLSCVAVDSLVEGATWFTSSMAPRHWIVAFRKHVFPVLHSPRQISAEGDLLPLFSRVLGKVVAWLPP